MIVLTMAFGVHAGYTKKIEEVTGSIGYFRCKGVQDLSMFESLVRLGGSFTVNVRWWFTAVALIENALCARGGLKGQNDWNGSTQHVHTLAHTHTQTRRTGPTTLLITPEAI